MRRLQQILAAESAIAELVSRRQRESRLQERVKLALPPMLATRVIVVDARSAELVLAASSGAAAALLRQRVPDLNRALAQEGWEFTGIRVRVQARPTHREKMNLPPKQIDVAAAVVLERLASELPQGELAAALRKLVRSAKREGSDGVDQPVDGVEEQDRQQ